MPLVEYPQNIRLDGQQQRKDRSNISTWAIDRWSGGLGLQRINVDIAAHKYRLWDAENVDTRWESGIVLSPWFNTCTISPSRGDLKYILEYIGNLYFCSEEFIPIAFKFTPASTLGSHTRLDTVKSLGSLSSILAFGSDILFTVLGSLEASDKQMVYHNGGLGSSSTLIASLPSQTPSNLRPELGDISGAGRILFPTDKNTVEFYTVNAALNTVTPVGSTPVVWGSLVPPMVTDGVTMWAQLPQGIFNFDGSPASEIQTSRSQDRNGAMTLFGQKLYFKNKFSLYKYDGADVTSVGYDREDGLPDDKWGQITAMTSSDNFLFAAVKGATYSHILTLDVSGTWQYCARIPTAGIWVKRMFLSDSPDAIDRLWCMFGNSSALGFFINPLTPPALGGTHYMVGSGYFTTPIYDGGLIETKAGWYDHTVIVDNLQGVGVPSTPWNIIQPYYAMDGTTTFTFIGTISQIYTSGILGSPAGVEGNRIQFKFQMGGAAAADGESTGTSPVFRGALQTFLKIPNQRESYEFSIDLEQTSIRETRPLEAVIGSLNSERNSRLLQPFWYGRVATKHVLVLDMPSDEFTEHQDVFPSEREGIVKVRVAEII